MALVQVVVASTNWLLIASVVAAALILWCPVMIIAERRASQARHEQDITYRDAIVIGLMLVAGQVTIFATAARLVEYAKY